jgi:hypothetical protein
MFGDVLSAKRIVGIVFYAVISNSEKYGRQILEADHSMTLSLKLNKKERWQPMH